MASPSSEAGSSALSSSRKRHIEQVPSIAFSTNFRQPSRDYNTYVAFDIVASQICLHCALMAWCPKQRRGIRNLAGQKNCIKSNGNRPDRQS